jgi:hypothetical protein
MSWLSVKLSEKTLSIASSALLLFIAIFLRLPGLAEQSLWIDEIMSLNLLTEVLQFSWNAVWWEALSVPKRAHLPLNLWVHALNGLYSIFNMD